MKKQRVNLLLTTFLWVLTGWAQPANDDCGQAVSLCPSVSVSGTNQGATHTLCPACADDFSFCFSGNNSVWFTFKTNATGGDVNIDFSNLSFIVQANRGNQLQAVVLRAANPCDGSTYTTVSNCEAGAATNFTLTATGLLPSTTYYVVVNGATNNGAALPAEASFDVIATGPGIARTPAALGISGPTGTLCPGQPVTFTPNVVNCTDTSSFSWYINGTIASASADGLWQTSEIQNGDVVTLSCSCFADCPQALTAQDGPFTVDNLFVNAGPDQQLPSGGSATLLGTTNGTSFYWTPAGTLAAPASLQTIALPTQTTTYFLTASDGLCTLSDDVTLTIDNSLTIPGSFSPNGDGTNDTWIIKGIDFYPNAHITIYNRWGEEILDIIGYSAAKAWDGKRGGTDVTDGVYYYVLDLRDPNQQQKEPLKGFVTVLR